MVDKYVFRHCLSIAKKNVSIFCNKMAKKERGARSLNSL